MIDLKPQTHAEAVAIFRTTVIGPVLHGERTHGQLAAALRALSEQRFRPPGAASTRTYSVPTLERWVYAYRAEGLGGLHPAPRSDRGFAQHLGDELRELLLDIRREHPSASVPLILQTLRDEGRLDRVGCDRELFADEALATLHQAAGSSLREIGRLATAALREAARRKKKLVEREVLARVVDQLPPVDG